MLNRWSAGHASKSVDNVVVIAVGDVSSCGRCILLHVSCVVGAGIVTDKLQWYHSPVAIVASVVDVVWGSLCHPQVSRYFHLPQAKFCEDEVHLVVGPVVRWVQQGGGGSL